MKNRPSYLRSVVASLAAMFKGMRLSGRHYVKGYKREAPLGIAHPDYFKKDQGPITIQYPMEKVPVPDTGRYRLFMETDDCIACDKCARICPVDCITIESFRADGDLGKTSDGTVKRLHLPVFDIDMGKCMYCGLCTTVCPTECLFMTPVYDFSEYDRDNLIYHFGAYSPEEEVRVRSLTEAAIAAKKAAKEGTAGEGAAAPATSMKRRPVIQRGPAPEPPVTPKEEEQPSTLKEEEQQLPSENPETPAPRIAPIKRRPIMQRGPAPEQPEPPKEDNPENKEGGPQP